MLLIRFSCFVIGMNLLGGIGLSLGLIYWISVFVLVIWWLVRCILGWSVKVSVLFFIVFCRWFFIFIFWCVEWCRLLVNLLVCFLLYVLLYVYCVVWSSWFKVLVWKEMLIVIVKGKCIVFWVNGFLSILVRVLMCLVMFFGIRIVKLFLWMWVMILLGCIKFFSWMVSLWSVVVD